MTDRKTMEATVAAHFSALRALDVDAWLATLAPDAVSYDPAGSPARTGHAELRPVIEGAATLFATADFREKALFPTDGGAALYWTCDGVTKAGKSVHFSGVDVFTFAPDGKIATMHAYWDPSALAAQLEENV